MHPRHGFQHSNETDQNELQHHYWVKKSGLGAFVLFVARIGASFLFCPTRCIKCNPGMIFDTITKLTQMNPTSLLGPKKWTRCVRFVSGRISASFNFWPESVQ